MNKPVRLLYIEDDSLDQQTVLRLVRDRNLPWETKIADTLAAARVALAAAHFDVIVADYHLPDGDCTELFDEVLDTPFVLVTGTLEEQLALRTLSRGADDYLPKDSSGRYLDALPFVVEKTLYRKRIYETEQRLTRELRESAQRLRANFENAASGILEVGPDFRVVNVNHRFCQMLGYSRAELLGKSPHDLTYSEDQLRSDQLNRELREGRRERLDYEKRYVARDGATVWVHVANSAVRDDAGRELGYIVTVEDISQRKAAEAALRESEEQFRTFFELAAVGTMQVDPASGRFLRVNTRYCQIAGYSCDELLRMTIMDVIHPDDREDCRHAYARFIQDRPREYVAEKRYLRRDGEIVWVRLSAALVQDTSGSPVRAVAVVEDITDRKRAEQQLKQAKTAAEEASRAKDHFLAVLSHELRTPLTPVLAATAMLEREPALSDDVRESLEMIRRNAELEARLIDDLLDVTRIARGKVELNRRPVEICTIVQRAVEVCRPDIEARQLQLGVALKDAPLIVYADAARIQQVFWNLLKNAIKFTPQGGCIEIRGWRDDSSIIIEVNDSGEGIEPEVLGRIFDAFEQTERAVTRKFGGLGLGLTISKSLVEMHGGTISARSKGKGQGATFTVRLPLHVTDQTARPTSGAAPAHERATPCAGMRVLLVEDHGDTARTIARLLTISGHQVSAAGAVATALQQAEQHEFDLLISDLGLPDGSGVDLIRELRSRGHTYPAIAMTGYGQEEDIARTRAAGFAAHVVKPIDFDQLNETIVKVMGAARQR